MKGLTARTAVRAVRRNPRTAIQIVFFAARHARAIVKAVRATKHASRALDRVRLAEVLSQRELRAAAASLGDAVTRVRKVGVANALRDRQATAHLERALRHASNAVGGVGKAPAKQAQRRWRAFAGVLPLFGVDRAWRVNRRG